MNFITPTSHPPTSLSLLFPVTSIQFLLPLQPPLATTPPPPHSRHIGASGSVKPQHHHTRNHRESPTKKHNLMSSNSIRMQHAKMIDGERMWIICAPRFMHQYTLHGYASPSRSCTNHFTHHPFSCTRKKKIRDEIGRREERRGGGDGCATCCLGERRWWRRGVVAGKTREWWRLKTYWRQWWQPVGRRKDWLWLSERRGGWQRGRDRGGEEIGVGGGGYLGF